MCEKCEFWSEEFVGTLNYFILIQLAQLTEHDSSQNFNNSADTSLVSIMKEIIDPFATCYFVDPSAMMTQMREDSAMMTQMRETQQTQPKHWLLQFKLCYFYTETLFMRFS